MKQHTLQLIVILSLSVSLVLTEDSNQVSSDLSVDKRDAILRDCNPTSSGSRCIIGCPRENRIPGNCPVGKCCRQPPNSNACTKYQGTCIDPADCKDPGYALPWRCPGGNFNVCCIAVGAIACGNGGRCIVDCPRHNRVIPGECPRKTGKCCKPPTDDVACNKEFGNCVQRAQCAPPPKYYLPWRCRGDEDRVCCHDPRFVLIIKWLDCLWRKIEATFYCLSNVRVRVSCILYFYSNDTEVSRETIELQPGQPFITKNFTVPSCYEDYLLVWTVHSDPEHTGYVVLYRCANAWGKKDPHMVTFSGHKYSYQGYCSYTLVKDCRSNSPAFDITADFRGKYNPMEPPTRMVAVSTTVNGYDTYTFRDDHSVLHNGQLVLERELTIAGGMGHITVEDDSVALTLGKDGVSLEWISKEHEASVTIGNDDLAGKLCGMLGDGSPVNDLVKSDGTPTSNVTEFAKSWEIPGSCP
ncbi:BMP-binding endothelial regulator protein-like [Ptychodera flava]|uniref:BMP-binding endothelial regulator protein-like n=1 Tax=Ptychodera flava TaxID=63121 RepID=UPI003969E6B2